MTSSRRVATEAIEVGEVAGVGVWRAAAADMMGVVVIIVQ